MMKTFTQAVNLWRSCTVDPRVVTTAFQSSEVNCEPQSEERSGEVSNQDSYIPMNPCAILEVIAPVSGTASSHWVVPHGEVVSETKRRRMKTYKVHTTMIKSLAQGNALGCFDAAEHWNADSPSKCLPRPSKPSLANTRKTWIPLSIMTASYLDRRSFVSQQTHIISMQLQR